MTIALIAVMMLAVSAAVPPRALDVPLIRQAQEHCGPAALEMVLRFYGADSTAHREAERAYDPVLHGALITDLAAAARRAGFEAGIATLGDSALVALIEQGVPPIVLYQNGRSPVTVPHYAVVVGWNGASETFTLHDGSANARTMKRAEMAGRWRTAGNQALVVRRRGP